MADSWETRPRPGRRRSPDVERAILDHTMMILIQRGYQGLTLDRIAAEASVSKATIYRRWSSKEEVVIAALGAIPHIEHVRVGNVVDDLTSFIQTFVDLVKNTPGQRQVQTRMVTMLPSLCAQSADHPELMEALHAYIARRQEPMRQILIEAIERGELKRPDDIQLVIDAIMGPVVVRLFLGDGEIGEEATRAIVRLVVDGINAGRHGASVSPVEAAAIP